MFKDLSPEGRRDMSLALVDLLKELWGAAWVDVGVQMGDHELMLAQDGEVRVYPSFKTIKLGGHGRRISLFVMDGESEEAAA